MGPPKVAAEHYHWGYHGQTLDATNNNNSKSTRESPQPSFDQPPGNPHHLNLGTPHNNNNDMSVNQNTYWEMEDSADDLCHIDDDDDYEFSQDVMDDLLGDYADYPNLFTTDNSTATHLPTINVVEEEPPPAASVLSPSGFFLTTTSTIQHANQPPT
jgi:hypothetical protein